MKAKIKLLETFNHNDSYEGETLETKVKRIVQNKEPITDGAPIVYTDRKDGVIPAYDIRTDRFEVAIEAMDVVSKSNLAKREQKQKEDEKSETEPTQTADNQ